MIGYKLFRVKRSAPGQLFPLYVLTDMPVSTGVWLPAQEAPVKLNGKVRSRIGDLAFRPGWHLSEIPLATHIGIKENGVVKYMHDDEVWCECEFSDSIDYQEEAERNGFQNGVYNPKKAYLSKIPLNGFYRFKTSPQMLGKWIIAGRMKVRRVLTDDEVTVICHLNGYEPLPRKRLFNPAIFGF